MANVERLLLFNNLCYNYLRSTWSSPHYTGLLFSQHHLLPTPSVDTMWPVENHKTLSSFEFHPNSIYPTIRRSTVVRLSMKQKSLPQPPIICCTKTVRIQTFGALPFHIVYNFDTIILKTFNS